MTWQADLAARAREALPAAVWDHISTGAGEEVSAGEAAAAWSGVRLWPRVLRDVTRVEPSTRLLGLELATPVGVAPTTMQRLVHPDGEVAMARGAADAGALHVVSSNAGRPFAALRQGGPWWLQAYVPPDRTALVEVVGSAVEAGASAVVLTVDTPVPGPKRRPAPAEWDRLDLGWFRTNFADPGGTRWAADLGPDDIGRLRAAAGVPVVVKGVLRPDDARTCVAAGADAVWVSNHGGRQLDRVVSTRHALPSVADAVGGDVPVIVDGGVGSGLDVLTALALGADAVLVGRLALHALASGGSDGVSRCLTRLTDELVEAMRLAGCPTLADTRALTAAGAVPPG